ncbi:hypothetical protein HDU67_002842, partial [Dinochytrium kinnereticum]
MVEAERRRSLNCMAVDEHVVAPAAEVAGVGELAAPVAPVRRDSLDHPPIVTEVVESMEQPGATDGDRDGVEEVKLEAENEVMEQEGREAVALGEGRASSALGDGEAVDEAVRGGLESKQGSLKVEQVVATAAAPVTAVVVVASAAAATSTSGVKSTSLPRASGAWPVGRRAARNDAIRPAAELASPGGGEGGVEETKRTFGRRSMGRKEKKEPLKIVAWFRRMRDRILRRGGGGAAEGGEKGGEKEVRAGGTERRLVIEPVEATREVEEEEAEKEGDGVETDDDVPLGVVVGGVVGKTEDVVGRERPIPPPLSIVTAVASAPVAVDEVTPLRTVTLRSHRNPLRRISTTLSGGGDVGGLTSAATAPSLTRSVASIESDASEGSKKSGRRVGKSKVERMRSRRSVNIGGVASPGGGEIVSASYLSLPPLDFAVDPLGEIEAGDGDEVEREAEVDGDREKEEGGEDDGDSDVGGLLGLTIPTEWKRRSMNPGGDVRPSVVTRALTSSSPPTLDLTIQPFTTRTLGSVTRQPSIHRIPTFVSTDLERLYRDICDTSKSLADLAHLHHKRDEAHVVNSLLEGVVGDEADARSIVESVLTARSGSVVGRKEVSVPWGRRVERRETVKVEVEEGADSP